MCKSILSFGSYAAAQYCACNLWPRQFILGETRDESNTGLVVTLSVSLASQKGAVMSSISYTLFTFVMLHEK